MKKIIIIVLVLIVNIAYTQDDKSMSNSDLFANKPGTYIKKEITDHATARNIKFSILKLTNLKDDTQSTSLRLETTVNTRISTRSFIASIDSDEVDGLIETLKYIKSLIGSVPSAYTEVIYTTRGRFRAGAYYNDEKVAWVPFLKIDNISDDSMIIFKESEVEILMNIITGAKPKLTQK